MSLADYSKILIAQFASTKPDFALKPDFGKDMKPFSRVIPSLLDEDEQVDEEHLVPRTWSEAFAEIKYPPPYVFDAKAYSSGVQAVKKQIRESKMLPPPPSPIDGVSDEIKIWSPVQN